MQRGAEAPHPALSSQRARTGVDWARTGHPAHSLGPLSAQYLGRRCLWGKERQPQGLDGTGEENDLPSIRAETGPQAWASCQEEVLAPKAGSQSKGQGAAPSHTHLD